MFYAENSSVVIILKGGNNGDENCSGHGTPSKRVLREINIFSGARGVPSLCSVL